MNTVAQTQTLDLSFDTKTLNDIFDIKEVTTN